MKCADPILCYLSPEGKRIFRHFSWSEEIFKQHLHQQVFNCGKCLPCRKNKANELAARCLLEASLYKENCFLTLTYDEKKNGYHNELDYSDIQKFKKRFRKFVQRTTGQKIRIFNVHEYGKNEKKHWHLICFNYQFPDKELKTFRDQVPYYVSDKLTELWGHGDKYCQIIGDVSEASALYQAQYMEKDFKHGFQKSSKKSHSQHSGIGKEYFLKHYKQLLTLGFIPFSGRKIRIPRYFEKIADKHYSYFYDPSRFHNTSFRKAVYRPFKNNEQNKEIADLYLDYKTRKLQRIETLTEDWQNLITEHLTSKTDPDFIKASSNNLYDLKNRQKQENF